MAVTVTCTEYIGVFNSGVLLPIAYEGEGRDGYRDQIVTCDVGVSLNSKTHPLFMKYSTGTSTQCYAYHYPSLFPVLLQSLYVPFEFFIHLYIPVSRAVSCALSTSLICPF